MAKDKMKILHVVGKLGIGGVENFVMDVIRSSDKSQFTFDICEMSKTPGEQVGQVKQYGVNVFQCPLRGNVLGFWNQFSNILKQGNYDCVHAHRYDFSAVPLKLAERAGVKKRIAHYHNILRFNKLSPVQWLYPLLWKKMTRKCATDILCCTKSVLDNQFKNYTVNENYKVVNYGIRLEKYQRSLGKREKIRSEFGINDQEILIGNCSRIVLQKDPVFFVQTAIQLLKQHSKLKFLLVGDGNLRSEVENLIKTAGCQDDIILTGSRMDVGDILSAFDIFFFPSRWEGFGISLMEAQAAGLPCVTSILPCFDDALAPEFHEFSFEIGDFEKAYASLNTFITAGAQRDKYSQIATQYSDDFSVEKMIEKIQAVYLS